MFKRIKRSDLPALLDRLSWYAVGGLAIVTLLSYGGRFHWALDAITNFKVQVFQTALLLAGICLWVRRFKAASALIALALLNYAHILPLYMGKPIPPADSGPTVRAMLINLNAGNQNTGLVLKSITTFNPDLLLLEEITPAWAYDLSHLADDYPHQIIEPREGCFGIIFLSKYPLERKQVVEIGTAGVPTIITRVYLPDGEISLIGTHPLPPMGNNYFNHRNAQLAELPCVVAEQKNPVLLVGDLNTTSWSPWFKDLIKDSGLKNSMKGYGFQPTWSSTPWFKIPIDHVLHSEEIVIHNRMVGTDVGSDHRPVIVDFSLRKK